MIPTDPFTATELVAGGAVSAGVLFYVTRRSQSVASITAGLKKTVDKLDRHALRKDAASERHKARVDFHFRRHEAAITESAAATQVAGNIRTLLGDTK